MTLRSLAFLFCATFSLGAFAQQTIVVDGAHSQVGVAKGQAAQTYAIKPGTQLVVDASKYEFKASAAGAASSANSLQLILGKDEQYSVPWDPARKTVTISAQTARPNGTSKAFAGFVPGQKVVVAIGKISGADFSVMWVGLADVK